MSIKLSSPSFCSSTSMKFLYHMVLLIISIVVLQASATTITTTQPHVIHESNMSPHNCENDDCSIKKDECDLRCNNSSPNSTCSKCNCNPNTYGKTCSCRYIYVSFYLNDTVKVGNVDKITQIIVSELAAMGKISQKFIEIRSSESSSEKTDGVESDHTQIQLHFLSDSQCRDIRNIEDIEDGKDSDNNSADDNDNDNENNNDNNSILNNMNQYNPILGHETYTLNQSYAALKIIGTAFASRFELADTYSITRNLRENIDFTSQLILEDQLCTTTECPTSVPPPGKNEDKNNNSLSTGVIVGIIVGFIVFLILVAVVYKLLQKKRSTEESDIYNMELGTSA